MRFRQSPAYGHAAREPSMASPWPNLYKGSSRQTNLEEDKSVWREPEQVPKQPIKGRNHKGKGRKELSSENDNTDESDNCPFARLRAHLSSIDEAPIRKAPFKRRKVDRMFSRRETPSLDESRQLFHRCSSDRGARPNGSSRRCIRLHRKGSSGDCLGPQWSLQPVLRSEAHPVFIQPVKEHVIRRWAGRIHAKVSRKSSSNEEENSELAPRLPRHRKRERGMGETSEIVGEPFDLDAVQADGELSDVPSASEQAELGQRSPAVASTSLKLPRHPVITSSGQLSREQEEFVASAAAFLGPVPSSVSQLATSSINLCDTGPVTQEHEAFPPEASTSQYFPHLSAIPQEPSPQVAERSSASQITGTRMQRSSTAGTTLFVPGLIMQATPNTKRVANGETARKGSEEATKGKTDKVESGESPVHSSSSSSSGVRIPFL